MISKLNPKRKPPPPKESKCWQCYYLRKGRKCKAIGNFSLVNVIGCGGFRPKVEK